jgi:hypothetical protein
VVNGAGGQHRYIPDDDRRMVRAHHLHDDQGVDVVHGGRRLQYDELMFVKLYSSVIMSSLWSEDPETRVLWITMLAAADREGFLFGSPAGLAAVARLPVESVVRGLEKFSSPDTYSSDLMRNPENEGRRIETVEGGWKLLNYEWYRGLERAEDRKAQYRESKRKQRSSVEGPQMSSDVLESPPSEAEAEADSGKHKPPFIPPTEEEVRAEFAKKGFKGQEWRSFWNWWGPDGLNWQGVVKWRMRVSTWITKRSKEGAITAKKEPVSGSTHSSYDLSYWDKEKPE